MLYTTIKHVFPYHYQYRQWWKRFLIFNWLDEIRYLFVLLFSIFSWVSLSIFFMLMDNLHFFFSELPVTSIFLFEFSYLLIFKSTSYIKVKNPGSHMFIFSSLSFAIWDRFIGCIWACVNAKLHVFKWSLSTIYTLWIM